MIKYLLTLIYLCFTTGGIYLMKLGGDSLSLSLKNEINCLKYRASVNTLHEAIKVICEDLDRITFSDEESSMAINAITVGRGQVLERPYVYVIGLSDKHYRQAFSECVFHFSLQKIKKLLDNIYYAMYNIV